MPTNHKPSRNLQNILTKLNDQALLHEGEPVTIKLTNNLRIDFRILGGVASLLLSRSSVFPGDVELTTVRRHWPYKIDKCGPHCPEKIVRGIGDLKSPIRHYLRCTWALQPKLLQPDRTESQPVDVNPR